MRTIEPNLLGARLRIGIVMSRFNAEIGAAMLKACREALAKHGVPDESISVVSVPGALETPLALQRLAQTGQFDAMIAIGAVIRGETYHFEVVANQSAAGIANVQLETGIPVANGILTTDNDAQALARVQAKATDCAAVAIEMANLLRSLAELRRV